MNNLFSKQAPALYAAIWEQMKRGEDLSGDAVVMAEAMREHPEFDPFWNQGETAFHPQDIGGSVVNPLVHIGLHVVIEKQLADEEPVEASVALKNLLQKGMPRHEAIHQIAQLWGDLYFRSVRRGNAFEEWVYLQELAALSETAL